jgi:hypothetical protein
MAMLLQKAGSVQLRTFTDGHPLRVELTTPSGTDTIMVLGVDDLHDLRYACDRMLAKVAEHKAGKR